MEAKRIIPCLDIRDGRVVKGVNFINISDVGDPVANAKAYSDANADEIVLLDITASKENRIMLLNTIEKVAEIVSIPITVGGGIRSVEDAEKVIEAGAAKISINSAAVNNPLLIDELSNALGRKRVVVAIDVKKDEREQYVVCVNGGERITGTNAVSWAVEAEKRGAGEILLTAMDRDGTKAGFNIEITKLISEAVSIPVTASGGAGSCEDFYEVFDKTKAAAALAASLFHYREIEIGKLKNYLNGKGIKVNL